MYESAGVKENDQLLDVGYSFGGTIKTSNGQFQTLHLTGLNIDSRQLYRARQEVKPLANNQIEFIEGDACQMPFLDASVDVILVVECMFHFPSRAGTYFTLSDYKTLARETGFQLTFQEDIARNILPTHGVSGVGKIGKPDTSWTTALVCLLSRLGLLRYPILNFVVED